MKSEIKTVLVAAVASATLTLPVMAAGVSDAQLLASQCNTCHGQDGQGAKPNPSINGEESADMLDILKAFASGDEPTSIMDRHALGYSDEQLKMLSDYYADK